MKPFLVAGSILVAALFVACNEINYSVGSPLRSAAVRVRNQTNFSRVIKADTTVDSSKTPWDTTVDTMIRVRFIVTWKWVDGSAMKATLAPGDSVCFAHLIDYLADSATVSAVFQRDSVGPDSTGKPKHYLSTDTSAASPRYFVDYNTGLPNVRAVFSDSLKLVVDTEAACVT